MQFGLFGGGAVSASWISAVPHLAARLGPVAASSYRVASRIVNSLRAGRAARECGELDACRVLLVSVPAAALPNAVGLLGGSGICWQGKVALLCNPGAGSLGLDPLRQRGAAIGSLHPIDGLAGRFVAEGDPPAVKEARRIVGELRGRMVELERGGSALYGAGLSFATSLLTPLIAASVDSLRRAGCTPTAAEQLVQALFQRTLRGWAHSGRKSWNGPLAAAGEAEIRRHLEALDACDPRAARYYRAAAAFALEYLGRRGELMRQIAETEPRPKGAEASALKSRAPWPSPPCG